MKKLMVISLICILAMGGCSSEKSQEKESSKKIMEAIEGYKAWNSVKTVDIVTEGDITYRLYEDNTATITNGTLSGDMEHIIPDEINGYKVSAIDYGAFRENAEGNIVLPDSLKIIGEAAFANNMNLKSVSIPEGVIYIGKFAFLNCNSIEEITIPSTIITLGLSFIANGTSLKTANILGGAYIPKYGFQGCNQLTEVNLPDSLTEIGYMAFSRCTILSGIELPNTLKNIQDYAFELTAIKEVNAPESLEKIYNGAFPSNGMKIDIAKTTHIGLYNFPDLDLNEYLVEDISMDVWGLDLYTSDEYEVNAEDYPDHTISTVTIPEGIEMIDMDTFKGFTNLKTVVLPSTLKYISYSAFEDCTSLTEIEFPEGLLKIDDYAFRNCTSLKNLNLPGTLIEIRHGVFENCTSITKLHIPESVTVLGMGAFVNTGVEEVTVPKLVEVYDSNLFTKTKNIKQITLSEGLKRIEAYAFQSTLISKLDIPDSVDHISEYAFIDSAIDNIVLSENIIEIG